MEKSEVKTVCRRCGERIAVDSTERRPLCYDCDKIEKMEMRRVENEIISDTGRK